MMNGDLKPIRAAKPYLNNLSRIFLILCISLGSSYFASASASASASAKAESKDGVETPKLFQGKDAPLSITLRGPWSEVAKDRSVKPAYRQATLGLTNGAELHIRIKPRGISRRRKDVCVFPPLRLNFPGRKETAGTPFEDQNKLKLVTHCGRLGTRDQRYSDQLFSEYLLYRIFNRVSDKSFRVQLLDITWIDTKNNASYQHPGFLIEHKKSLVERLGGTALSEKTIPVDQLESGQAALGALFAYFAGNTDFSFARGAQGQMCCHNSVPVKLNDREGSPAQVVSVPYDFDSTGFVDPAHAEPLPNLGIQTVRQRVHRGYCAHSAAVPDAVNRFAEAEVDINQLIGSFQGLSERRRKKLSRYTQAFYRVLADSKQVERNLKKRCR